MAAWPGQPLFFQSPAQRAVAKGKGIALKFLLTLPTMEPYPVGMPSLEKSMDAALFASNDLASLTFKVGG